MKSSQLLNFSPGRILLASVLGIIGIGTVLLNLSIAQAKPITFFDALFTAVSTVCVTGLSAVPMSSFSSFGHAIILALIQIGGLGLMTFSYFFLSLFLNLGMGSQMMAGELFEFSSWSKIKSFLTLIIAVTVGFEILGTLVLMMSFQQYMPADTALFYALFHSVSAFCNAGISLYDTSLHQFSHNQIILGTIGFLVSAGGIGFVVWYELIQAFRATFNQSEVKATTPAFSLHTKIVLWTTGLLNLAGALSIWAIEKSGAFADLSNRLSFTNALFYAVSMRSAGFTTIDMSSFAHGTILILLALMFIGASPGSTGSGIKTTTFVLYCAAINAIINNRDEIEISGRTIPSEQMHKAIAIITVSMAWIIGTAFLLMILHPSLPFVTLLVEALSAFSTSGVSLGVTAQLSYTAKIILMCSMIVGRIGPLTLVLALKKKSRKYLYRYPEERILIG